MFGKWFQNYGVLMASEGWHSSKSRELGGGVLPPHRKQREWAGHGKRL